jgi:uncharacterized protein YndB with AHSA1/START domain
MAIDTDQFPTSRVPLSDRVIEREAVVDVPPAEAFRLWSTTEGITSWLVETANVDLQIGGRYELFFGPHLPEGQRGSEGCQILAFLPDRMLVFSWNSPPTLPDQRNLRTWVVLTFEPVGDSQTRMLLHHLGWPEPGWSDGSDWPKVYAYFDRAWTNVTRAFADHCSAATQQLQP